MLVYDFHSFHIAHIARSHSSFLFRSSTGTLVFASRRVESVSNGEGQLADGRRVVGHASQFPEMGNEMLVVGSKQVVDKELEGQAILHAGFIYGHIGAEQWLAEIDVLLMPLGVVRHHKREHCQLGVKCIVETERCHWLVESPSLVSVHVKPLLVYGSRKGWMPETKCRLQGDR